MKTHYHNVTTTPRHPSWHELLVTYFELGISTLIDRMSAGGGWIY
jgi:hypothetical protein